MQELKIRTHGNENLSKAIQDELKKMGYVWRGRGEYIESIRRAGGDCNIIYAQHGGFIGWDSNLDRFGLPQYSGMEEVTIYDLIEMNAQKSTKQEEIRAIREEMEVLAARLKEAEK